MKNRIFFIFILLSAALLLAACGNAHSYVDSDDYILNSESVQEGVTLDYYVFNEVDALLNFADHIIRGIVLDERVEIFNLFRNEPDVPPEVYENWYLPHKIYRILVTESFFGSVAVGEISEVWSIGSYAHDTSIGVHGQVHLPVGEELVLLLNDGFAGEPFWRVNISQSAFQMPLFPVVFTDDFGMIDAYEAGMLDSSMVFPNVATHSTHLELTISDLMRFADEQN